MKLKKLLGILMAVVMVVCLTTVAFAATEPAYTEVDTYDKLVTALGEGKDVKLTADITAPDKAVLTIKDQILDLGNCSLTLNGESGKLENGTIQNGTIEITTYEGDSVADGMFDVYGPATVSGVTFHSDGSAIYAIFDIKSGDLTMTGCTIDMVNNNSAGGLLYFNGGNKLTMTGCTVTGTDIGDFISNGTVEMNDCAVTLKGTKDGALDNGINGTALTLNNTSVTIDGATGRGITTDGDAIAINGTSNVTLTNCAEGGIRYKESATITVADTASLSGTVKVDPAATAAKVNDTTVEVTGEKLPTVTVSEGTTAVKEYVYPVYVGTQGYDTLAEAFAAVGSGDVVIELLADATLDYNAREAYGVAGTTSLTINGNNHTLTLNQKDGDWSSLGLANTGAKLVLNDMTIEKTGYGDTSGAWNTHAIIITSGLEMTDVTVNNSVAVQAGAKLTDVTINEANDYYSLWITANGQTVEIDGLTVNSAGRGIKIDEQYVDDVAKVTLSVKDATFTTAKKAAIVVKSAAGATITTEAVDITNVAADSTNPVWVDEDSGAVFGNVTVNGKEAVMENADAFKATVVQNGVRSYYKNLDDLFADYTLRGEITVTLLGDIVAENVVKTSSLKTYNFVTSVEGGVTMDLQYEDNWNYFRYVNIGENVTVKAKYLVFSYETVIEGTVDAYYPYINGAEVTVAETGVLTYAGGDGLQVKGGATLTVYGTVNAPTVNVWGGDAKMIVSGANAKVNANWIDIWEGTPSVVIKDGATVETAGIKVSRGGSITVDNATLNATTVQLGHNGESAGKLDVINDGEVIANEIKINHDHTIDGGTYHFKTINEAQGELTITGGIFSEDPSAYCEDSYTGASIGNGMWGVVEATFEEIADKAIVTITVTPADAEIVISKDGTEIARGEAGEYTLPGGEYTYTVSKAGYYTEEGTFTVDGENTEPVTVSLAKLPTLYTITKAECENGSVTAQAIMAAKGSTIKVSAEPAEGYKLVALVVTDAAGNEIEVVDGKFTMPASNVTVSATFVYDLPFTDVADDNEHYNAIAYMYVNGLMIGTSTEEYVFSGEMTMTRAQIAQILYRLAGEPAAEYAGTFTDVAEGAWYAEAVEWAAAEGIVNGVGNDKFAPNREITVAELATLVYRYAQCKLNGECVKTDWLTESAEAMTWCVDNGVLAEGTDGSALADRYLTADMFYAVSELVK